MKHCIWLLMTILIAGCGTPTPMTGDRSKKITWSEYQTMDAEQKTDPYVLENLDEEAKKKLVEMQRKKR